jgi:hypothetical protein
MCQARDKSAADRIGHPGKYNRNCAGLGLQRRGRWSAYADERVRLELDQFPREQAHAVYASGAPAIIDMNAATIDPSQLNEPLAEGSIPSLGLRIGLGE